MTASLIPPPIVQSTYAGSIMPEPPAHPTKVAEELLPMHDRQAAVEADIQFLLDAQAEGLVRGSEGGEAAEDQSTGTTTPTGRSVRSGAVSRPGSRQDWRKLGLKSVRRGIYKSIVTLSSLKEDELHAVDAEIDKTEHNLAQIGVWERKRQGLQDAVKDVDDANESIRMRRLQQEADTLQDQINQVELQLAEMKTRHRNLSKQIAVVENTTKAKLASYTNSMEQMEDDVRKFLSLRPSADVSEEAPPLIASKTSVWELPPTRRTLGMAKTELAADRDAAKRQRQHIEHERTALHDGAEMWHRVIDRVGTFERQLRAEMATRPLPSSSSDGAWEEEVHQQTAAKDRMDDVLKRLDVVIEETESDYALAETQSWKLLIAAIGAELYALKQGRQVLNKALKAVVDEDVHETAPGDQTTSNSQLLSKHIDEQDATFISPSHGLSTVDTNEDPDPELMFSRRAMDD